MKALVIITVLLIILVGFSIWFEGFIHHSIEELIDELSAVPTEDDPLPALDEFLEHWKEKSSILEISIDHEEIDLMNNYLWSMYAQAENGMEEDFLMSKDVALHMLEHIETKNSLQLNNIF